RPRVPRDGGPRGGRAAPHRLRAARLRDRRERGRRPPRRHPGRAREGPHLRAVRGARRPRSRAARRAGAHRRSGGRGDVRARGDRGGGDRRDRADRRARRRAAERRRGADDRLHREGAQHQRRARALAADDPGGHHRRRRPSPEASMIEATLPRVRVALALPALLCPAGCGAGGDEPLLQSTDGRFRVVYQGEGRWLQDEGRREMESALARIPHIDVVYAHNDPMARGAQLAAQQAGRSEMLFIGIDALPHEGRVYVEEGKLDATFEYPTGGAEAVDLAILAVAGVALPKDIVLGTRAFTRENVAS